MFKIDLPLAVNNLHQVQFNEANSKQVNTRHATVSIYKRFDTIRKVQNIDNATNSTNSKKLRNSQFHPCQQENITVM